MAEENPENQVKKEEFGAPGLGPMERMGGMGGGPEPVEKLAPMTPMQEPPPSAPKRTAATQGGAVETTHEASPGESGEPAEEPTMRQRQQQVNQRVGLQGQKLPGPRLKEGRQKPLAPIAPVAGAAKKAAKKWAKIALPLGSVGAGGILGYFLT